MLSINWFRWIFIIKLLIITLAVINGAPIEIIGPVNNTANDKQIPVIIVQSVSEPSLDSKLGFNTDQLKLDSNPKPMGASIAEAEQNVTPEIDDHLATEKITATTLSANDDEISQNSETTNAEGKRMPNENFTEKIVSIKNDIKNESENFKYETENQNVQNATGKIIQEDQSHEMSSENHSNKTSVISEEINYSQNHNNNFQNTTNEDVQENHSLPFETTTTIQNMGIRENNTSVFSVKENYFRNENNNFQNTADKRGQDSQAQLNETNTITIKHMEVSENNSSHYSAKEKNSQNENNNFQNTTEENVHENHAAEKETNMQTGENNFKENKENIRNQNLFETTTIKEEALTTSDLLSEIPKIEDIFPNIAEKSNLTVEKFRQENRAKNIMVASEIIESENKNEGENHTIINQSFENMKNSGHTKNSEYNPFKNFVISNERISIGEIHDVIKQSDQIISSAFNNSEIFIQNIQNTTENIAKDIQNPTDITNNTNVKNFDIKEITLKKNESVFLNALQTNENPHNTIDINLPTSSDSTKVKTDHIKENNETLQISLNNPLVHSQNETNNPLKKYPVEVLSEFVGPSNKNVSQEISVNHHVIHMTPPASNFYNEIFNIQKLTEEIEKSVKKIVKESEENVGNSESQETLYSQFITDYDQSLEEKQFELNENKGNNEKEQQNKSKVTPTVFQNTQNTNAKTNKHIFIEAKNLDTSENNDEPTMKNDRNDLAAAADAFASETLLIPSFITETLQNETNIISRETNSTTESFLTETTTNVPEIMESTENIKTQQTTLSNSSEIIIAPPKIGEKTEIVSETEGVIIDVRKSDETSNSQILVDNRQNSDNISVTFIPQETIVKPAYSYVVDSVNPFIKSVKTNDTSKTQILIDNPQNAHNIEGNFSTPESIVKPAYSYVTDSEDSFVQSAKNNDTSNSQIIVDNAQNANNSEVAHTLFVKPAYSYVADTEPSLLQSTKDSDTLNSQIIVNNAQNAHNSENSHTSFVKPAYSNVADPFFESVKNNDTSNSHMSTENPQKSHNVEISLTHRESFEKPTYSFEPAEKTNDTTNTEMQVDNSQNSGYSEVTITSQEPIVKPAYTHVANTETPVKINDTSNSQILLENPQNAQKISINFTAKGSVVKPAYSYVTETETRVIEPVKNNDTLNSQILLDNTQNAHNISANFTATESVVTPAYSYVSETETSLMEQVTNNDTTNSQILQDNAQNVHETDGAFTHQESIVKPAYSYVAVTESPVETNDTLNSQILPDNSQNAHSSNDSFTSKVSVVKPAYSYVSETETRLMEPVNNNDTSNSQILKDNAQNVHDIDGTFTHQGSVVKPAYSYVAVTESPVETNDTLNSQILPDNSQNARSSNDSFTSKVSVVKPAYSYVTEIETAVIETVKNNDTSNSQILKDNTQNVHNIKETYTHQESIVKPAYSYVTETETSPIELVNTNDTTNSKILVDNHKNSHSIEINVTMQNPIEELETFAETNSSQVITKNNADTMNSQISKNNSQNVHEFIESNFHVAEKANIPEIKLDANVNESKEEALNNDDILNTESSNFAAYVEAHERNVQNEKNISNEKNSAKLLSDSNDNSEAYFFPGSLEYLFHKAKAENKQEGQLSRDATIFTNMASTSSAASSTLDSFQRQNISNDLINNSLPQESPKVTLSDVDDGNMLLHEGDKSITQTQSQSEPQSQTHFHFQSPSPSHLPSESQSHSSSQLADHTNFNEYIEATLLNSQRGAELSKSSEENNSFEKMQIIATEMPLEGILGKSSTEISHESMEGTTQNSPSAPAESGTSANGWLIAKPRKLEIRTDSEKSHYQISNVEKGLTTEENNANIATTTIPMKSEEYSADSSQSRTTTESQTERPTTYASHELFRLMDSTTSTQFASLLEETEMNVHKAFETLKEWITNGKRVEEATKDPMDFADKESTLQRLRETTVSPETLATTLTKTDDSKISIATTIETGDSTTTKSHDSKIVKDTIATTTTTTTETNDSKYFKDSIAATKEPEVYKFAKDTNAITTESGDSTIHKDMTTTTTESDDFDFIKNSIATTTGTVVKDISVTTTENHDFAIENGRTTTTTEFGDSKDIKDTITTTTKPEDSTFIKDISATTTDSDDSTHMTTTTPAFDDSEDIKDRIAAAKTTTTTTTATTTTTTESDDSLIENDRTTTTADSDDFNIGQNWTTTTTESGDSKVIKDFIATTTGSILKDRSETTTEFDDSNIEKHIAAATTESGNSKVIKDFIATTTGSILKDRSGTTTESDDSNIEKHIAVTTTESGDSKVIKDTTTTDSSDSKVIKDTTTTESGDSKDIKDTTTIESNDFKIIKQTTAANTESDSKVIKDTIVTTATTNDSNAVKDKNDLTLMKTIEQRDDKLHSALDTQDVENTTPISYWHRGIPIEVDIFTGNEQNIEKLPPKETLQTFYKGTIVESNNMDLSKMTSAMENIQTLETTTETDMEVTTLGPLLARVQLEKDVTGVKIMTYLNDSNKEIIDENQEKNDNIIENTTINRHSGISQSATEGHVKDENDDMKHTHTNLQKSIEAQIQNDLKAKSAMNIKFFNRDGAILFQPTAAAARNEMMKFADRETTEILRIQDTHTARPLTQATFMEEQEQQIDSTTTENDKRMDETTFEGLNEFTTVSEMKVNKTVTEESATIEDTTKMISEQTVEEGKSLSQTTEHPVIVTTTTTTTIADLPTTTEVPSETDLPITTEMLNSATELWTSTTAPSPMTEQEDITSTTEQQDIETTTLSGPAAEQEGRSLNLPPPKLEYLQNADGVEVFYGYSTVKRNNLLNHF